MVVRRLPIAALFLAASAARADAPVKDWSQNIETVVVTAHKGGPLLWRVSKGASSVVIVALVEPWPKDLGWDQTGVRAALQGAREMLLPPGQSEGMVEALWFLTWHSDSIYLSDDTPMESTLSPGLRARFVAAREKIHQDADRYAGVRVPLAGLRFEGDFLKDRGLTQDEPMSTLKHLAREADVSSRPIAEYEAFPMLKRLPEMSTAANETCLKASLDDADSFGLHAVPAAQAWAKGDLDGVEAHYSELRFEACIQAVPGLADLFQRAVNDSMNALNDALAQPGKTVMVVTLGEMLRKNGILDRLGAEGLRVDEY